MEATCCYIVDEETGEGCPKSAEWEVYSGPHDDGTLACSDHVGHLLTDAPEHRVYPFRQRATQEGAH